MSPEERNHDGSDGLLSTVDSLPLAQGLAGGIGAFAGGFVTFVTVVGLSGSPDFGTPIRTAKQIGSLFYNAQNIPLLQHREILVGEDTIVQEASVNLIQQADPSLPPIVYYAVPVVAIAIVAGVLTSRYVDSSRPRETAAAIVAGMTLGYVLSALVGTVLVAQRSSLEGAFETLAPDRVWTLGVGITYPLAISVLVIGVVVGWRRFNGATDPVRDAQT